jgi:hypothetical protein
MGRLIVFPKAMGSTRSGRQSGGFGIWEALSLPDPSYEEIIGRIVSGRFPKLIEVTSDPAKKPEDR